MYKKTINMHVGDVWVSAAPMLYYPVSPTETATFFNLTEFNISEKLKIESIPYSLRARPARPTTLNVCGATYVASRNKYHCTGIKVVLRYASTR